MATPITNSTDILQKNITSVVQKGFISATDVSRLLGELSETDCLVIRPNGNTYEVFKGNVTAIKWEKLKNLSMKLTRNLLGKISNVFDNGGNFTKIRTTSFAQPSNVVAGFGSAWEKALHTPENFQNPVVGLFLEELSRRVDAGRVPEELQIDREDARSGDKYSILTLKDWPVKLVVNSWGTVWEFIFDGVRCNAR